jgi:transposase
MVNVTTIGIDLAKSVFQLHGVDAEGSAVLRRQLKRSQMLEFFQRQPTCLIGMEACAGAHYWARELVKRECLKLCVSDRVHAVFRYVQASKRPVNIMAS